LLPVKPLHDYLEFLVKIKCIHSWTFSETYGKQMTKIEMNQELYHNLAIVNSPITKLIRPHYTCYLARHISDLQYILSDSYMEPFFRRSP
jgi:hypothetical protein